MKPWQFALLTVLFLGGSFLGGALFEAWRLGWVFR